MVINGGAEFGAQRAPNPVLVRCQTRLNSSIKSGAEFGG